MPKSHGDGWDGFPPAPSAHPLQISKFGHTIKIPNLRKKFPILGSPTIPSPWWKLIGQGKPSDANQPPFWKQVGWDNTQPAINDTKHTPTAPRVTMAHNCRAHTKNEPSQAPIRDNPLNKTDQSKTNQTNNWCNTHRIGDRWGHSGGRPMPLMNKLRRWSPVEMTAI